MNDIKVTLMLADHAQAVGGKLYISGGGWSITGPAPTAFAIALDMKIPWHGINIDHTLRLELLDADGQPVEIETPDGPQSLRLDGTFQATPGAERESPARRSTSRSRSTSHRSRSRRAAVTNGASRSTARCRTSWRLAFSTRPDGEGAAAS